MPNFRFLVLVMALLVPAVLQAAIGNIQVLPPNPTNADSVRLSIDGYFGDGCWSVQGIDLAIDGFNIDVTVRAFDSWYPGTFCPTILVPYGSHYQLGRLSAGSYTVFVHESVVSFRGSGDSRTLTFEVAGPYYEPTPPQLITPVGNPILYDSRPWLCWTSSIDPDVNDTVRYELQISTDASFFNPRVVGPLDDTAHAVANPIDFSERYWWRVVSRDRYGFATMSDPAQFRLYIPGDLDESWSTTTADVVTLINYVFRGGSLATPPCAANVSGDDIVNSSDIILLVNYLFKGGVAPKAGCGAGPEDYFPITLGTYWVYEYELFTDSLRWEVVERNGDTATIDRPGASVAPRGGPITVRRSGDGVDLDLPGEGWVEYYHFTSGRSWTHRDPFDCDDGAVYVALEEAGSVVTPAGTFFNCLRIQRVAGNFCADAGTTVEWWAPGVGLVKWEEQSIAGPRYGVLKMYHIAP
jgi:hypothetical protein